MISYALLLPMVNRRGSIAPHEVFLHSDSLKVLWIHTRGISAQVVNGQTRRDFSFPHFIRESVGLQIFGTDVEGTVTASIFFTSPKPAG